MFLFECEFANKDPLIDNELTGACHLFISVCKAQSRQADAMNGV